MNYYLLWYLSGTKWFKLFLNISVITNTWGPLSIVRYYPNSAILYTVTYIWDCYVYWVGLSFLHSYLFQTIVKIVMLVENPWSYKTTSNNFVVKISFFEIDDIAKKPHPLIIFIETGEDWTKFWKSCICICMLSLKPLRLSNGGLDFSEI